MQGPRVQVQAMLKGQLPGPMESAEARRWTLPSAAAFVPDRTCSQERPQLTPTCTSGPGAFLLDFCHIHTTAAQPGGSQRCRTTVLTLTAVPRGEEVKMAPPHPPPISFQPSYPTAPYSSLPTLPIALSHTQHHLRALHWLCPLPGTPAQITTWLAPLLLSGLCANATFPMSLPWPLLKIKHTHTAPPNLQLPIPGSFFSFSSEH